MVALAGAVVVGGAADAASVPWYTPVAGSAAPFAGHTAVIASVPGATRLSVQVWLKPDTSAAETFATASQLRAAYGANGANTGRSQTIALVELGLAPRMFHSLQVYAAAMKLPVPSKTRYQELALGKNTDCADWADEEQLDVEASYAMAPSAHQLVVSGNSCAPDESGLQALDDADVAVLNGSGSRPLATIVSNSWGNPDGETQSAQLTAIQHAYLVQAAAEGVGMYFASGDNSGVEPPASDPYAITVGGTTVGLGKANNRLFETGWSTDGYVLSGNGKSWTEQKEMGAASGGASLVWAQPAYQAGVVPAALATPSGDRGLARAVPDISADGDPLTGIDVYGIDPAVGDYGWQSSAGTSLAAPLVAGIVADAQQGQARPFGFLNPALYQQLADTAALRDVLPSSAATPGAYRAVWCEPEECAESETQPGLGVFDAQSSEMHGYTGQVTQPGYDTMTGLGTPNGESFITALRALQE
jgi:subtilase family serine protease